MITIVFIAVLLLTIQITNTKNDTKANEDILEFNKKDSMIIFICFMSSFVLNKILELKAFKNYFWVIIGISFMVYLMILIIVNNNREKLIKKKQEQIIKIYQALIDILGKVDTENIDFTNTPFEYEEDKKLHTVCNIKLDTSLQGGRFNDNTITLSQYSINKFFPELQWTSIVDYPKRELTFKGLPKPPNIAKFPGSDYRPTGWIPLGLSGEGEVGWNMGDPKKSDMGSSSYINEEGKIPDYVKLPSAPQCLTLGSTGGGKSIWIYQEVEIND